MNTEKLSDRLKREYYAVIHLSKEGDSWWRQLISEIQMLETPGDVTPKRRFVFVEGNKALPNVQLADTPDEIAFMGKGREIYELTQENRVK